MAVWSSVPLSSMPNLRLDPEYYTPANLAHEKRVHSFRGGWKTLGDMAEVITDGDHLARDFRDDGVLFLTSEHFGEFAINYSSDLFIDAEYERTLARARSEPWAIYLTKTGAHYGKAAVCPPESATFNISADVAKIKLRKEYDPAFVAAYLNSATGFALIRRQSTGGTRDRIVLENLRTIPVPIPPASDRMQTLLRNIWQLQHQSLSSSSEAEHLLSQSIGLDEIRSNADRTYIRRFSVLRAESRFDAEYFNPKYQEVIGRLRKSGLSIGDVATLAERPFNARAHDEDTLFRYIEIGSLTGDGEADPHELCVGDAPSRASWVVREGDVITSTVRPIRRLSAIILKEQDGCVCSSGFVVLSPKKGSAGIESEVLLTYLRLPVIAEILNLHTTATMYPAISVERLMTVPIVIPPHTIREQIVAKVRDAIAARKEAEVLVAEAKRVVEEMIAGKGK